jgi:hypothetical protein
VVKSSLLPPGVSWYPFLEAESTPGHMAPSVATEEIPSDTSRDRSRDPPTSSAVPQPLRYPRPHFTAVSGELPHVVCLLLWNIFFSYSMRLSYSKIWSTRRKTCPGDLFPSTNSTFTGPGLNRSLHGDSLLTNRLIHGRRHNLPTFIIQDSVATSHKNSSVSIMEYANFHFPPHRKHGATQLQRSGG